MSRPERISDQARWERINSKLRALINDFLEHLRYVVRQDWAECPPHDLAEARERYQKFADQIWNLILDKEHPDNCPCEICFMIRVAEDR